ncbi:hypothetical protein FOMPIDRAFT_1030931 [Fomitopsis schrenkii]|uniref:Autophagy-related protein 101 n=1 Tax=Fomitopsis schrenkii TaxID=2126942 RepID=S8E7U9_FOMSC|nr:hypothetical protein FOMPIDRAFT_1030931 [Fomitopsis schrenkii]
MEKQPNVKIDLVLERHTAQEVLRAVLHSILFHRLFGTVKPQTFEVLDVTMPGVDDPEIRQLVDSKVEAFWKSIEGGYNKSGKIIVTFSERRPKKSWFYSADEEVPWEQWIIDAQIRQPTPERDQRRMQADLSSALTRSLKTMLTHASSERGRAAVPLITNANGISPFPIKITVKVGDVEVG